MAAQIESSKVVQYVAIGSDNASASKVTMWLILEPGEIEPGDTATRQSHVSSQIIRRS